MHAYRGRVWARISAQIYNDVNDIDRLGEAVTKRLGVATAGARSAPRDIG
jgi:selenocysteine lyase/cysteine desulfurase